MPYKSLLLTIFLFFVCANTFADVFVVTSNADSGPGTLRDALTQAAANGTAVKDYINFNIADTSQVGRTISIFTNLPDMSSNLIIDGSTQTGGVFGASTARIEIATPQNYNPITVINGSNINNLEVYGIYFYDYYDSDTSYPGLQPHVGIKLSNCSNFIFGAAGKGNLMRGFNIGGLVIDSTNGVALKGNLIGFGKSSSLQKDGDAYGYSSIINITECNNIQIGGDGPGEGNDIFTFLGMQFYQGTQNSVSIKSNNFMVYPDGKTTEWAIDLFYYNAISISTIFPNNVTDQETMAQTGAIVNMDIENNLTGGTFGIFGFNFINGTINFTKNYFNVARDGITNITYNTVLAAPQNPVSIQNCQAQFNFGNTDINQKNLFYNCGQCVTVQNDPNVYIRNNDFKCLYDAAYINNVPAYLSTPYILPTVSIDNVLTNGAHTLTAGTSTPNSIIDIYSSESCQSQCSIRSYLQTVTADNSGNWQADILNLNGIFYVSATLNNQTSTYKTLQVNSDNVNIQPMRCSDLATIAGLIVPQGVSYYWTDYNGNIVSTDLNLNIHKVGQYRLVLGGGCITSQWFTIIDDRVTIYDASLVKTNASCSQNTGSIKNLFVYDPLNKIKDETWTDAGGNVVGASANATNLPSGSYTLNVTTTDGCTATYGPITLTNTTGPNIDQSNAIITPSNCGSSTGSITNINATGSGTLTYSWKNDQQQVVSTAKDLINQPTGNYTLQVTDQGSCGPIYSSAITIPEANGITIDTSAKVQTPAACGQNNGGSITNIKVTGATTYQWINASGTTVSTQLDLTNVAVGQYHLLASNGFCNKETMVFTIAQQTNLINYAGTTKVLINATCGLNNGSIQVIFEYPVVLPTSYRWVNSSGQTVGGNSATLNNIDAGTYQLYGTDSNGCEKYLISYSIGRTPGLTVNSSNVQVNNDNCQTGIGSIKGITAAGATPINYTWTDASGNTIGTNPDLLNLSAGTYNLKITDGSGCEQDLVYTLQDVSNIVPAPSVSNLQLCTAGEGLLSVNNPSAGYSFRLYDSATSTTPLDDQGSGKFKIAVSTNRSYYISQYTGACESARAEADVSVGLSKLTIANTFTPNNDDINDTWTIDGLENYPNSLVQIYNRFGQRVFQSKGYAQAFDGKLNGHNLPAGTYYYIINLNTKCDLLSGSITILR